MSNRTPAEDRRQNTRDSGGRYASMPRSEANVVLAFPPQASQVELNPGSASLLYPPTTQDAGECQRFWSSVQIPDATLTAYLTQVRKAERKAVQDRRARDIVATQQMQDFLRENPQPKDKSSQEHKDWRVPYNEKFFEIAEQLPETTVEEAMGRPALDRRDVRAAFTAVMMARHAPTEDASDHREAVLDSTFEMRQGPPLRAGDAESLYGVEDIDACLDVADSQAAALSGLAERLDRLEAGIARGNELAEAGNRLAETGNDHTARLTRINDKTRHWSEVAARRMGDQNAARAIRAGDYGDTAVAETLMGMRRNG